MNPSHGSHQRRAMVLHIWIPQRASGMAMKALQEHFPYRPGDRFDHSVTDQNAPTGFHLASISRLFVKVCGIV